MKRTSVVGILCLVVGGALGLAQGKYIVYGHGNDSCGLWTSQRSPDPEKDEWPSRTSQAWVLGFVSGVGFESPLTLTKTDTAGIRAWMDAYCAAHPLESIARASAQLIAELSNTR